MRIWSVVIGATICLSGCWFAQDVAGQGTGTGWVIANQGDTAGSISPGQNSTQVFAGAGSLGVPNSSVSPGGNVNTQTNFPGVKVSVDSAGLGAGQVAYGAAYFEDSLTVLGGVGEFEMTMRWSFDGGISGSGGEYWVGADPGIGSRNGSAAANFRSFLQPFGQSNLDLADPDLFKDVALQPNGILEVPVFDPSEPYASSGIPGSSSFLFDEYDEEGNPTGFVTTGWYTDQNAGALAGTGGGARFTWQYGQALNFGILLEGWAADGGMVDFFNTGMLTEIELPSGATLLSAGGGSYNVTNAVPEPGGSMIVLMTLSGLVLRRKRNRPARR